MAKTTELAPLSGGTAFSDADLAGNDLIGAGISNGSNFSTLSIKAKKWTVKHKDESKVLMKGRSPISELDVVIIETRQSKMPSKKYYPGAYNPDQDKTEPACQSWDGVTPDVAEPQCASCALCPHNAWGSGFNGKGKACRDYKRLYVVLLDPNTGKIVTGEEGDTLVCRLDIPAASLKNLKAHNDTVTRHRKPMWAVVTTMYFDPDSDFVEIKMDAKGLVDNETLAMVRSLRDSDELRDESSRPARKAVAALPVIETPKALPVIEVPKTATVSAPAPMPAAAPDMSGFGWDDNA